MVLKVGREKTEKCTQAKKFPQRGKGKKGKQLGTRSHRRQAKWLARNAV